MDKDHVRILLVEDDEIDRMAVERLVRKERLPYDLSPARTVAGAIARLGEGGFDLVLIDHRLPDGSGLEVQRHAGDTPCIFITAAADLAVAVEAMKAGAYDSLVKDSQGVYLQVLPEVIQRALDRRRMEQELGEYRARLEEMVEERTAELEEINRQLQQEIAERVRAEEALRESEALFKLLVTNMDEALTLTDLDSTILFVNEMATEIFGGWGENKLLGRNAFTLIAEESLASAIEGAEIVLREGVLRNRQYRVLRADGSTVPAAMTVSLIRDAEGNPWRFVAVTRDISEQVQAEAALRESEERLKEAQAMGRIGNWEFDIESQKIRWSDQTYELYERDPILGPPTDEEEAAYYSPEQAKRLREYARRAIEEGKEFEYDLQANLPSGKIVHFTATMRPIKDENGRIVKLFGTAQDITARARTEEALRQRTAQLEALREMGLELTAQLDLNVLLYSVASRAVELLGGSGGGLYLYRPEQDVLEWTVSVDSDPALIGTILHRGEGAAGRVLETGEPIIVDDYRRWEGRMAIYERYIHASIVQVPVRWSKEFLGVLAVNGSPSHTFSQADVEMLSLFATQAAIAMRNARLHEQTLQDAQTKATLLREVNHRVNNNLTAIIGLLDLEQRYTAVDSLAAYRTRLKELANRVYGLATVHRVLSATQWSSLLLSELARQIIGLGLRTLPPDQHVTVEVSPSPVRVSPKDASNLALTINELTTNSVKYAWPARRSGHIAVHIDCQDDVIRFEFRDDGQGYPQEVLNLKRHGSGWDLIQLLVGHGLQGEVDLHNDRGAVTTIRFPASE